MIWKKNPVAWSKLLGKDHKKYAFSWIVFSLIAYYFIPFNRIDGERYSFLTYLINDPFNHWSSYSVIILTILVVIGASFYYLFLKTEKKPYYIIGGWLLLFGLIIVLFVFVIIQERYNFSELVGDSYPYFWMFFLIIQIMFNLLHLNKYYEICKKNFKEVVRTNDVFENMIRGKKILYEGTTIYEYWYWRWRPPYKIVLTEKEIIVSTKEPLIIPLDGIEFFTSEACKLKNGKAYIFGYMPKNKYGMLYDPDSTQFLQNMTEIRRIIIENNLLEKSRTEEINPLDFF